MEIRQSFLDQVVESDLGAAEIITLLQNLTIPLLTGYVKGTGRSFEAVIDDYATDLKEEMARRLSEINLNSK